MKLSPNESCPEAGYPDISEHYCFSRDFLKVALALGLYTSTMLGPTLHAQDAHPAPKLKVAKLSNKEVSAAAATLVAKLNDRKFKVREAATLKLVQLGKGEHSHQDDKATVKQLVIKDMMAALKAAKDPEVTIRLKRVLKALQPPAKIQVREEPHLDGDIIDIQ